MIAGALLAWGFVVQRGWHGTIWDAYITFRYAEMVLDGHGPVFNPGEWVEGFSNPLWLVQLVVLGTAGLSLPTAAKVLGVAHVLATLAALLAFPPSSAGDRPRLWSAAACVLLLLDYPATVWATQGLETPQYTLWLTLWSLAALRTASDPRRSGEVLLIGAIAPWVRPEGVLLVAASVVFVGWVAWKDRVRPGTPWIAASIAILGLLFGARLALYGDWLPNTYYAKHVPLLAIDWQPGIRYLGRYLAEPGTLVHLGIALAGLVALWRFGGRYVAAVAIPAVIVVAVPLTHGGDWMPDHRLLVPLGAPLAVCGAHAVALIPTSRRFGAVLAAFAALVLADVYSFRRVHPGDEWLRGREALLFNRSQPPPPDLVERGILTAPPRSRVAIGDMTSATWERGDLVLLDLWGLTSREIGRLEGVRRSAAGVNADYLDAQDPLGAAVAAWKPDRIVTNTFPRGLHAELGLGSMIWGGCYEVVDVEAARDGERRMLLDRRCP